MESIIIMHVLLHQESELSQGVQDPVMGKKLWEASESIVKLGPNDPRI